MFTGMYTTLGDIITELLTCLCNAYSAVGRQRFTTRRTSGSVQQWSMGNHHHATYIWNCTALLVPYLPWLPWLLRLSRRQHCMPHARLRVSSTYKTGNLACKISPYFVQLRLQMFGLYTLMLSIYLFVCLFVYLSPVKFVKSFATWQHLASSGCFSYRLRFTCLMFELTALVTLYIHSEQHTLQGAFLHATPSISETLRR